MKPTHAIPVRDLVEFMLRRGDLSGDGDFMGWERMLEGTRGHQRLQKSRPEGYEKEVALDFTVETEDYRLTVRGRIDGMIRRGTETWMEEIKTVTPRWRGLADPLHWAQLKVYAAIHAHQAGIETVKGQLTYLELESGQLSAFTEKWSRQELEEFWKELLQGYGQWLAMDAHWKWLRNESLAAAAFPFRDYRPGQRKLAVAVYRAILGRQRLLAEAPTGIGKTVSVLFPALKTLRELGADKLFYLTAKTVGRATAEKALADLRAAGARVRGVTLTAREKICLDQGRPCDRATCPLALGYYDRVKPALRAALEREEITRPVLEEIGRQHQVCPAALALDVAGWCDVVIGDYNHALDPTARLRGFFGEDCEGHVLLVDEAHNLPDRAREMFSAELDGEELAAVAKEVAKGAPGCAKTLRRIVRHLAKQTAEPEKKPPSGKELLEELSPLVERFLKSAEAWLVQDLQTEFRPKLLDLYFRANGFLRVAEGYDERFATILEGEKQPKVRLFCVDPSHLLGEALRATRSAVFFSATLSPTHFFRELLAGRASDTTLQLPSPYPPENLLVLIARRIGTSFRERGGSLDRVAEAIHALIRQKRGNYLVYFPSYQYLGDVLERFRAGADDILVRAQKPGMSEEERADFVNAFEVEPTQTMVGFAVMGGVFGEAIDLVGERLVGAVIVGVGLPQIGVERDLIREYFEAKGGLGFEYAYQYPGMNKVLQAAGRVIRSETDRGIVLLIDSRFSKPAYEELLPKWWGWQEVDDAAEIKAAAAGFWADTAPK